MDKTEIKKAMTTIQNQLKNVFEIIMSRYEDEEATDAMGAKKPLGGWSCISCQKNIPSMASQIADY